MPAVPASSLHPPPCDWCPLASACATACARFSAWVDTGRDPEVSDTHRPPPGLRGPDAHAAQDPGMGEAEAGVPRLPDELLELAEADDRRENVVV